MMSKIMLIPYVLLGHKPRSKYKFIDFLTEHRKPTDSISSLKRHDLSSITDEYDGLEIVEQRFFLLYDELKCPVEELESQFEKMTDNKSLRLKAADCSIGDTFESLGFTPYADGKEKAVRLVVVAHFEAREPSETDEEDNIPYDERERAVEGAKRRGRPSDEARIANYRLSQVYERPDAAFNARPLELLPSPLSIYEPAFQRFVNKYLEPLGDEQFTSEELMNACTFIQIATEPYDDEGDRQRDLSRLKIIRGETLWVDADMQEDNAGDDHDGNVVVDDQPRFPTTIFLSNLDTDPTFHGGLIYIKLAASDEFEDLRWRTCCPAFIIAKADRVLSVFGAVFADRFFFSNLATLYLGHNSVGVPTSKPPFEGSILQVARLFRLMSEAVVDFQKRQANVPLRNLSSTSNASSGGTEHSKIGPAPGQFPLWNTFESDFTGVTKTYTINYKRRLTGRFDKPVYKATMKAGDGSRVHQVVVKFTHQYGVEGHKLLARERLAPQLYFAEFVWTKSDGPGLWVIVMEYVKGKKDIFGEASEEQRKKLQDAVSILHRGGFALGKVRESNVCIRGRDELYITGFDWCCREKEGKYPSDIFFSTRSREEDWHGDVGPGQRIEKEHDLHTMKLLLKAVP